MYKLPKIIYTRVFTVCIVIYVTMKRRNELWDKQIIISTEYMILFIINGIVINLPKFMTIGLFKYRVLFLIL